jgi:hypothetical protein
MWVTWDLETTARQLIESLREAAAEEHACTTLLLRDDFVHGFRNYSETDAREVLGALGSSRISVLEFDFFGFSFTYENVRTRSARRTVARIEALIEVLGSIHNLRNVHFFYHAGMAPRLDCHLLQGLTQIKSLELTGGFDDPDQLTNLTQSVENHATLCCLKLRITSHECNLEAIVGMVRSLPRLDTAILECQMDGPPRPLTLSQTQTLCDLFTVSSLGIASIKGYNFTQPESCQALCDVIRGTLLQGLYFDECIFADSVQFAQAVTSSSIKLLRIGGCGDNEKDSELFAALGEHFSAESLLEELDMRFYVSGGQSPNTAAQAAAVRGSTKCPHLRRLFIYLDSCAAVGLFDEEIARCMEDNLCLEHVGFSFSPNTGDAALELPFMNKALSKNFTLKIVTFDQHVDCTGDFDMYDDGCDKQLEVALRLNCMGRAYMATEPINLAKAWAVLGRVNDSLDCLFYHLRENPAIVSMSVQAMSKRQATTHGKLNVNNKRNNPGQGGHHPLRRTRQKLV